MLMKTKHTRNRINIGNIALAGLATLLLIGGGMVYVAFRSISLRMFGWFEALGLMEAVDGVRGICSGLKPNDFVLYNLPDLLWITSYLVYVNALIPKNDRRSYLFWSLSVPLLAILHEIMQGLGMTVGSFDCIDLLCYIIPAVINIIISQNRYFHQNNPKFNHQLNTAQL